MNILQRVCDPDERDKMSAEEMSELIDILQKYNDIGHAIMNSQGMDKVEEIVGLQYLSMCAVKVILPMIPSESLAEMMSLFAKAAIGYCSDHEMR